jgi:hypothetical protein
MIEIVKCNILINNLIINILINYKNKFDFSYLND